MKKSKLVQKEINESGVVHVVNDVVEEDENPGGYFIEKSRKTELFRLKDKEDAEFHKNETKETFWEKLKRFLN